jgi:hypothetical protein
MTVLILAAPAFAGPTDFPNQGLEDRMAFWKKVYTQYGENDVIIHDRIRVNLIYDIAARGEENLLVADVRRALDEIRANLSTPENLNSTAKQIQQVIVSSGVPLTRTSADSKGPRPVPLRPCARPMPM